MQLTTHVAWELPSEKLHLQEKSLFISWVRRGRNESFPLPERSVLWLTDCWVSNSPAPDGKYTARICCSSVAHTWGAQGARPPY